MGNKICCHPRLVLTEDIALHFRSCNLVRDILPIISRWRSAGAELCFTLREFEHTFDVVQGAEAQFQAFDSKGRGRVDAYEILMTYILMSTGVLEHKLDTIFSTFGFSGSVGPDGSMSFDESMLVISACIEGVVKACRSDLSVVWDPTEALYHCKSLFDMHRLSHKSHVTSSQFKQWVFEDPSPNAFVGLLHNAQGLGEIFAQVQRINEMQGKVFQKLAGGRVSVLPQALKQSPEFKTVLHDPTDEEVNMLVRLMVTDSVDGTINPSRFHAILRSWNIFIECDLDNSGTLDEREIEILLWIQTRQRPTPEFTKEFVSLVDRNADGNISRQEWVEAVFAPMESRLGSKQPLFSRGVTPDLSPIAVLRQLVRAV